MSRAYFSWPATKLFISGDMPMRKPIGIATAVYLEEYSSGNRFARFIDINIRNLAGVPSVVYGILGLTVFVALFASLGDSNGKTGGLTLAVLVLPIVIITSAEAIRAVPNALREAGFGLGASRSQVIRKLILPAAGPGILTGTVLALARAIGETAPLILVGAVLGSFSTAGTLGDLLTGPYTALPSIIFDWARKPQQDCDTGAIATKLIRPSYSRMSSKSRRVSAGDLMVSRSGVAGGMNRPELWGLCAAV